MRFGKIGHLIRYRPFRMMRADPYTLAAIDAALLVDGCLTFTDANRFRGAPFNTVCTTDTQIPIKRYTVKFPHIFHLKI